MAYQLVIVNEGHPEAQVALTDEALIALVDALPILNIIVQQLYVLPRVKQSYAAKQQQAQSRLSQTPAERPGDDPGPTDVDRPAGTDNNESGVPAQSPDQAGNQPDAAIENKPRGSRRPNSRQRKTSRVPRKTSRRRKEVTRIASSEGGTGDANGISNTPTSGAAGSGI